jgi:hypothetical protein
MARRVRIGVADGVEVRERDGIGLLVRVLPVDGERVEMIRDAARAAECGGAEQPLLLLDVARVGIECVRTTVRELIGRVIAQVGVIVRA